MRRATKPPPSRARRGFATIMAIVLLLLVGATLVAMGTFFVAEARRTRAVAAEAQLRQLLTAGAAAASAEGATGQLPRQPRDVTLPAALASPGAKLTLEPREDSTIVVRAQLGPRRAEQTVRFARDGAGDNARWKLVAIELADEPPGPATSASQPAAPASSPSTSVTAPTSSAPASNPSTSVTAPTSSAPAASQPTTATTAPEPTP